MERDNACYNCRVERPCDRANCLAWQKHEELKAIRYANNTKRADADASYISVIARRTYKKEGLVT